MVAEAFFYLLDDSMFNALVLYRGHAYTPMNIVQFKMELIEGLVGKMMEDLFDPGAMEVAHLPVHIEGNMRSWCAYCT